MENVYEYEYTTMGTGEVARCKQAERKNTKRRGIIMYINVYIWPL